MTYLTLRLVHILFMTTWIGAMLFTSGDVRRSLAAGPEHLNLLKDRVSRSQRLSRISAILTLLSGFALIQSVGGMGAISPAIHTGLLLALVAWGLGEFGQWNWKKVVAALEAGQDKTAWAPMLQRMRVTGMVFHTLWLITLLLMVFRTKMG